MSVVPDTMLAAVYHPGNNNLVLDKKYPLPLIETDEILLRVSASGLCHSDVLLLTGASVDTRTYVSGHEILGVPVRIGNQLDTSLIKLGKLYSVLTPDSCDHGSNGGPVFTNALGLGVDGGYVEYVIVKAVNLVPVPGGVSPGAAAVASDARITACNAVKYTAGERIVTKRTKALTFGVSGLGHLAVQFAKHLAATVYVCHFKPQARKLALDLGADVAFNLTGFTLDTTMDFVAN
ncbi:chaperonin 10-like protein [Mycena crocata]|nr:chaperonin 10-like protein [Mycena crocata]